MRTVCAIALTAGILLPDVSRAQTSAVAAPTTAGTNASTATGTNAAPAGAPSVAPFVGSPEATTADPTPTPSSLFVPVKPGAPAPPPAPASTPSLFLPSPIAAPALQAGPVTRDVMPSDLDTPSIPVQRRSSTGTTTTSTSTTTTTRPRSTEAAPAPKGPTMDQVRQMVAKALKTQDASLALRIGWAYYGFDEFSSAGQWFNQALEWNPALGEASYGLALSKMREGDLSSAEAIVNFRRSSYPKMKTLEGDIAARRAVDAYTMEQYAKALKYIQLAGQSRALTRNERIILAWSLLRTGQPEPAAEIFEALYRNAPDQTTAEGLYSALNKLEAYEKLDELSALPGPLGEIYATYDAKALYKASLFRASASAGGAKLYPVLENVDSPTVALGTSYKYKSGSSGEGQMQEYRVPSVQGAIYPSNNTMISGRVSYLVLDSGSLGVGANIGKVPKTFTPYSFSPTTHFNNLWEFAFRFEYQDWWSFYFELGTTPINGLLTNRPVGNVGLIFRHDKGYYQGEFYSKSVKESLLSYVGIQDPYSGEQWGRVTETGGSLQFFHSFLGPNLVFAKTGFGVMDGTNTEDNTHFYATLALAREFKLKGFEYLTLGPAFSFEHFDNNQNNFTYGNGGYFSPDYLFQGLLQANFLTTEGKNWIFGGSAAAGVQTNRQGGSPYFPLNPDGREFPAQNSTTVITLVNGSAAYLFRNSFLVGVSGSYAITADYNEGFASVWIRYFFEPRNGLLRTDLSFE